MNNVHMVLLKKGLTIKRKTEMLDQIKDVDGVKMGTWNGTLS